MMHSGNVKMAFSSLRRARGRSFLTMLGIIVGVTAVVITLSIGGGVRRQITDQLNSVDKSVVVVRPGSNGNSTSISGGGLFNGLGVAPLTNNDLTAVQQTSGVSQAVPLGIGSGIVTVDGKKLDGSSIVATSPGLPQVLRHPMHNGIFFNDDQSSGHVAVIGQDIADQLFEEEAPIGRALTIRGQDFVVLGVFEPFAGNSAALGADLNKAVFIPYATATGLTNDSVPVAEIFAQVDGKYTIPKVSSSITKNLVVAHNGQQDFVVMNRQQNLQASSNTINIITQFVVGMAALSLLVGGIGIVNIMLVSVSERTREIGIRKAVGATNRQIRNQFLTEAATLSAVGGIIGVLLGLLGIFLIRIGTNLHPVINLVVIGLVPLAAWVLGIVFGVMPAIRAARKEPIEALRYE